MGGLAVFVQKLFFRRTCNPSALWSRRFFPSPSGSCLGFLSHVGCTTVALPRIFAADSRRIMPRHKKTQEKKRSVSLPGNELGISVNSDVGTTPVEPPGARCWRRKPLTYIGIEAVPWQEFFWERGGCLCISKL